MLRATTLDSTNGRILININSIESVRGESGDGIVRMVSGQEHRVKGVATSERWPDFLQEIGMLGGESEASN